MSRRSLLMLAGPALLIAQPALCSEDLGVRVLIQEWNPLTPAKQSVHVALDIPTEVTSDIRLGWGTLATLVCQNLTTAFGRPGAIAGQTLRDIECEIGKEPRFDIRQSQFNQIEATITIDRLHAVATTTVPDPFNFDPRVSIDMQGQIHLTLALQPQAAKLLSVKKATFHLVGAHIDSHNASADIAKWIAEKFSPFFGGPDFRALAENAIDSVGFDLTGKTDTMLGKANASVAAPSGMIRSNAWLRPDYLIVAFMPAETLPTQGGLIAGVIDWTNSGYAPPDGCNSVKMYGTVQTTAAPLQNPDDWNSVGAPKTRNVGWPSVGPVQGSHCTFTLAQLATGWPTVIHASIEDGPTHSARSKLMSVHAVLRGDGWDGMNTVPNATDRNYRVTRTLDATDVPAFNLKYPDRGDPVSRPPVDSRNAVVTQPGVVTPTQPAAAGPSPVQAATQSAPVVQPAAAPTPVATATQSPAVRAAVAPPIVPSAIQRRPLGK